MTQLDALGYAICLEARGFLAEAVELRRLHEVEKQHNELLESLRATAEALAHYAGNGYEPVVEARAAIAKAEKK